MPILRSIPMSFTASVITTKEWGSDPPRNAPFRRTVPRYVVIHHTFKRRNLSGGTIDGAKETASSIQHYHMGPDNFWSDSGHNFFHCKGGILLEGRHGSIAAAKAGFSVQSAHALQNDPVNIRGHREFSDISCPGDWLYGQIGRLQAEVRSSLDLPPPDSALATKLGFGSRGLAVSRLQERLRELGFIPGPSDGDFGEQTLSAVIHLQTSSDLNADGIVGPKTLAALGIRP